MLQYEREYNVQSYKGIADLTTRTRRIIHRHTLTYAHKYTGSHINRATVIRTHLVDKT